jgi:hypothetical protein
MPTFWISEIVDLQVLAVIIQQKIEILLRERLAGTDLMLVFKNKTAEIRILSSTVTAGFRQRERVC